MIHARLVSAALLALAAFAARAQEVVFKDPIGDDNGPGKYVYPTDKVYKPGSFDLTELRVTQKGDKVTFAVSVNSDLEDPWAMPAPANFSVQMAFVFVKTGKGGFTKGIPGLNVVFAPDDAWNKVVILSPQGEGEMGLTVHSWDNMRLPTLLMYGSRDFGTQRRTPTWRSQPFYYSPPGHKYDAELQGATHMTFVGPFREAGRESTLFQCVKLETVAFWDAYLKGDSAAKEYLLSNALEKFSPGVARIDHK